LTLGLETKRGDARGKAVPVTNPMGVNTLISTCGCRLLVNLAASGGALIAVMKATDLRDRHDAPARWGLHLPSMGAVVWRD
jgi:hypothetical protein